IHSDVHRAAHARAMVKFSVRAPGPDMSMPPLRIGNQDYRGFYDVRVVRMSGRGYTTEDMLRTRRRTLWLSHVISAIARRRRVISGFRLGDYLDFEKLPAYTMLHSKSLVSAALVRRDMA